MKATWKMLIVNNMKIKRSSCWWKKEPDTKILNKTSIKCILYSYGSKLNMALKARMAGPQTLSGNLHCSHRANTTHIHWLQGKNTQIYANVCIWQNLRWRSKRRTTEHNKNNRLSTFLYVWIAATYNNTRSIWKMLGPFATTSRLTPIQQMSLAVLSRAACASMSTTKPTTTTTRDRGDRYGPMEWAQWSSRKLYIVKLYINIHMSWNR